MRNILISVRWKICSRLWKKGVIEWVIILTRSLLGITFFSGRIVLFGYLKVEGGDGGSYIDRVIFCVVLEIVLVGDETLTEVSRIETIF